MVYEIKWTDYDGNSCILEMRDTTDQSDKTNYKVELKPSSNPFVTNEDADSSPLKPVRTQSATICFLYDGVFSMVVTNSHQWRVRLWVDGSIKWLGWLKGENFNQPFVNGIHEIELNCIDDLSALSTWNMRTDRGRDFGLTSIKELMNEAFEIIRTWDSVTIQFPTSMGLQNNDTSVLALLGLKVCRFNFFTVNENTDEDDESTEIYEGDDLLTMLEKICKYFGWSLRRIGTNYIFSYIGTSKYLKAINMMTFFDNGTNPTETESRSQGDAPTAMGENHLVSLEAGKKKISVVANVRKVDAIVPELDPAKMKTKFSQAVECTWLNGNESVSFPWVFRYMETTDNGITLNKDDGNLEISLTGSEWQPNPDDTFKTSGKANYTGFLNTVGAHPLRSDYWGGPTVAPGSVSSLTAKRNFDFESIILCRGHYTNKPLIILKSKSVAMYSSGALQIGFDYHLPSYHPLGGDASCFPQGVVPGGTPDSATNYYFICALGIGSKWWNGSAWQTTKCTFNLNVWKYDRYKFGHEIQNKGLGMNFDSNHYCATIDAPMQGQITFEIYGMKHGSSVVEYEQNVLLKNIVCEYVPPIDILNEEDAPDHHTYSQENSGWSEDLEDVDLSIHTFNNDGASYSVLVRETQLGIAHIQKVYYNSQYMRPEMALLAKYVQSFGSAHNVLTVKGKTTDNISPLKYCIIDGKKYEVIAAQSMNWLTNEAELILREYD